MKSWKPKLRRGFALFLALMMCASTLQVTALAAAEPASASSDHTHEHNSEGWICTPYCSLQEHTHTEDCYNPSIWDNKEETQDPVTLPDNIPAGTDSDGTDDFGNEYAPPEIVVQPDGDGKDETPDGNEPSEVPGETEPTVQPGDDEDKPTVQPGEDEDASGEGQDQNQGNGSSDGEPAGDGEDGSAVQPGDGASVGEPAGDGESSDSAPTGDGESSEDGMELQDMEPPLSEEPQAYCGMTEHIHTAACAETEGGGWHCFPNTNITINIPHDRVAIGSFDLLSGVTTSPAFCGNWPVSLRVVSVAKADGSEAEVTMERWLKAEEGVFYNVEYAAYVDADDPDIPQGNLAYGTSVVEGVTVEGVARIEDVGYATLQEAITAAGNSRDTIYLLSDVYENITSSNSYTLDLQGYTVHSNVVGKNVFTITGGNVTIENGGITGGDWGDRTNQDGKGVKATNADVTLRNCEVKDNRGYSTGGGVYVSNGTLTMEACTVSGNSATTYGGGIYATKSAVTLTNGTKLLDNTANSYGGGAYVTGGALSMDNVVVNGNSSVNSGTACGIYAGRATVVDIQNTVVTDNPSTRSASALYLDSCASANLVNVEIEQEEVPAASSYALYARLDGELTMEGCSIHDSYGGVYLLGTGTKTLTNCQFTDNICTATSFGAPLYVYAGSAEITGCTFTGNTGYYAGAIRNASTSPVTLDGCLIRGNTATYSTGAGGIYAAAKTIMEVSDTVIKENQTSGTSSSGPAGGISVNANSSGKSTFTMTSGAVYNNTSVNTTANDIYAHSYATINILAGADMQDGTVDFSSYAWSNLSNSVLKTALTSSGNWTATPTLDYAAIVDGVKYETLSQGFVAARNQSRKTGEPVTVDVVGGYVPLDTYYGLTTNTADGPYPANVVIRLNDTHVYGIGSATTNCFSIAAGNTLTLSGTGTINKKVYLMGGTLNLDGNVVISGANAASALSAANAPIYSKGTTANSGIVNITGDVDKVQVGLAKGSVTVSENAHVGKLEISTTTGVASSTYETHIAVNGQVDTFNLTQSLGASTVLLNGHIGALKITHPATTASIRTVPVVTAGENCFIDSLTVVPSLSITSSYDSDGRTTTGQISIYALQNPEQDVSDLLVIRNGAGKYGEAVWSTSLNNTHSDKKDYKFLTSVTDDADGNVVMHKVVVNGNYVLIDSTNGKDSNSGLSLSMPVKSFERAKEVLEEKNLSTIHVLGAISVTGEETWSLENGQKVESFPTYNGALVRVANGAELTLENVTIDGMGIQRTTPLIENSGTLNIKDGTVLTGGFNTAHLYAENHAPRDGGAIWNGGTLNMSGGVIENNTARNGGGVFSKGTFNLSGGEIRSNSGYGSAVNYSTSSSVNLKSVNAGGGVFLGLSGSVMNMSGGTISGNTAAMGGGISLGNKTNVFCAFDNGPKLIMTGGTIDGNTSQSEGGGIFIQERCEGTITGGEITNNRSLGGAFGGGGIYVNGGVTSSSVNGKLHLENVAVVNNSAGSNGGGIAGCPTSNLGIYLSDGGVIANNTADNQPYDLYIQRLVSDPYHTGKRGTAFISKYMLGGGLYNWIDRKTGERMPSQSLNGVNVFLYGTPEASDVEYAMSQCKVLISGNYAANAGGGLGTNGDITIGNPSSEDETFDVTFHKSWLNYQGKEMTKKELEQVEDQLKSIGFVLWRRPVTSSADGSISDNPVPLADVPAEGGTGLDFGPSPEGEGWKPIDYLFRGWNGSTLNTADFWGAMTFKGLLPGYEYAISEIPSSTYEPKDTRFVYFDENDYGRLNDEENPAFINELKPAKLILTKVVKDDNGVLSEDDLEKLAFTFKITLIPKSGAATETIVTLKPGEIYEIDNLTPGTRYSIQELLEDGSRWYVTSEGKVDENVDTGDSVNGDDEIKNILEVGNNTVTFTNSTTPFGSLTVKKAVVGGSAADKAREWNFTIKLYTYENNIQSALSPTAIPKIDFGTATPVNSEANDYTTVSVKLKDGESYTINYLPLGVSYDVTEDQGSDFPSNCTVTYKDASGTIKEHNDNFTAAFTNTLPVPQTVNVEVHKVWDDGDGSDRPEHITVQLLRDGTAYGEGVTLSEDNNWSYTWSGLAKHHEDDQTTAYVWTVEEVDVPDGYTVSTEHTGDVWTITNSKPETPPPPGPGPDPDPDPDPDPTPERPTLPELPDPNDPESPEEVIIVEDDVPTTYVKVWDPEEEEFVYIPEDDVPLADMDSVPQTGDNSITGLLTAVWLSSAVGLFVLYQTKPRKKDAE